VTPLAKLHHLHAASAEAKALHDRLVDLGLHDLANDVREVGMGVAAAMSNHVKAQTSAAPSTELS
jgi:hypothetical protein